MPRKASVLFYGTPQYSVPCLQALLDSPDYEVLAAITQPDKPAGRGNKLQSSPVKILAEENNLPVLQPESIKKNQAQFETELQALGEIDIAIVIAFGQILPIEVLDYPKHGSLNLHASLLPKYRGAAPIQRAIMSGDTETGVCLMKMEAGLDSGPVYSQMETPISADQTGGELHDQLSNLSAELLIRDLEKVISDELKATEQNDDLSTYAKKIDKTDELIDWNQNIDTIYNQIRALSPIPTAYTFLGGSRLKIIKCTKASTQNQEHPGTITFVDKKNLEIACLDGTLSIKEVKYEGKRQMKIDEFLQGIDLEVEQVLE